MIHRVARIPALFALTALAAITLAPRAVVAQPAPEPPSLSVSGSASVDVPADQITVIIGVITEGDSAKNAIIENNRSAARTQEALRTAGFDAKEISTRQFRVSPIFDQGYNNQGRPNTPPRISGYRIENTVELVTSRTDKVGDAIQAAIDAGANSIPSVQFGLTNSRAPRDQAVREAVQNARADAHIAAAAAGVTIIGVRRISIDDSGHPAPMMFEAAMARGAGGSSPPIQAGDVSVHARVTVEFLIQSPKQPN